MKVFTKVLQESSLVRFLYHFNENKPIAIISASRKENTRKKNEESTEKI